MAKAGISFNSKIYNIKFKHKCMNDNKSVFIIKQGKKRLSEGHTILF